MRLPFFAHKMATPINLAKNDYMHCVSFGLPHRCLGQRASIYIVCISIDVMRIAIVKSV